MKKFFIMLVCCLSLSGNGCLRANPANVESIFSGCSDNTQSHQCYYDDFCVDYKRLNLAAYGYARFDTLQQVLIIQDEISHTEKNVQALFVVLGAKDEKIDWNKKVYIYTQKIHVNPDKHTRGVFVSHLSTSELSELPFDWEKLLSYFLCSFIVVTIAYVFATILWNMKC